MLQQTFTATLPREIKRRVIILLVVLIMILGIFVFVWDGEPFGGVAGGHVCGSYNKAYGFSGSTSIGYYGTLLHEMGPQFGASHTFNSIEFGNQLSPITAVEIGYGLTIMSYRGRSRRLFYHSVSINQMRNFVQNEGNCASMSNTGNRPPTANAGNDFIIPKSTPFLLEGTANDPDSSNLTHTWEQVDTEEGVLSLASTAIRCPVFGWLLPTKFIYNAFLRRMVIQATFS